MQKLRRLGAQRALNYERGGESSGTAPANIIDAIGYLATSQFWFESFQNWQSGFLAIAAMVIPSIFLRQRGSPESKPVDAPHHQTGTG